MTTIKVKTRSGEVTTMQVQELMEVDGEPYRGKDSMADAVIALQERVAEIEAVVFAEPAEVPA